MLNDIKRRLKKEFGYEATAFRIEPAKPKQTR